jgi:hypothetical protein
MRLVLLVALVLAGCSTTPKSSLTDKSFVGTWECGPTTMHGPNFDVAVTTRTANRPDHTYSSLTTSVITPQGQLPITNKDQADGTWSLDGDIITSTVQRVEFLSSSDPKITKWLGQQIQDAQLKMKSVYQSRILIFDGITSRSVPVNSMYKEAVVESSCKRV